MQEHFPQVLVVTANAAMSDQLRVDLESAGCCVTVASGVKAAFGRMREQAVDFLLVDAGLPEMAADLFGRCVRSTKETRDVYLVLISAAAQAGGDHESVDDYLGRGYAISELRACLRRGNRHLELLRRERQLERADRLAETISPACLEREVNRLLGHCRREPPMLACLLVDVRAEPATCPSEAGDGEWFRSCAELLNSCFRVTDYVCRATPSSLAVLLPDCDEGQALLRAQHVARELASLVREAGRAGTNITMGVAEIDVTRNSARLLQRSRRALEQARHDGSAIVAASTVDAAPTLKAACGAADENPSRVLA